MGAGPSTSYYQWSGGGGGGASVVQVSRNGVSIKKVEATGGGGGGAYGSSYADGGNGGSWNTSYNGGTGGGGAEKGVGLPGTSYIDNVYQGTGGYPSNGNGSASITIYYIIPS